MISTSFIAILAICYMFATFRLQWLRREIDDYRGRITYFGYDEDEESYLEKSDEDFIKESIPKIKKDYEKKLKSIWTNESKHTLEGSIKLFDKRYKHKCDILKFLFISTTVLLSMFIPSIIIPIISSCILFILIYVIVLISIFVRLHKLFKNDY